MKVLWPLLILIALVNISGAQVPSTTRPWRYTLLEGSMIIDDCPICGRPTIAFPLRGTFDLFLDNLGPLFATFRITNVQFYAGSKTSPFYSVTGQGSYQLGGQLAVQQQMSLQTETCNPDPACRDVTYTNSGIADVAFPLIRISVTETTASLLSVYTMQLVAAPVRELWFVVTNGFTPTNGAPMIHAGDVLSQSGRIVRTRDWLTESNGFPNPPAGLRVDALDAAPGAGLVFSVSHPNVTPLLDGDLLSERGYRVRRNQQLTAAFGIMPVVPDVGLDAVQVMAGSEVLFSIRTNIFAEAKGMLRHGDVLSSLGQIVRSHQQLLARFHPTNTSIDYGLDALYVWPNGEIWFSTEAGFQDQQRGEISDGDLLSTEGIVVFKNRELVAALAAPAGDFGLGDIFVVTDASVIASQPTLLPPIGRDDVLLRWTGTNRVYQVERATDVTGSWEPIGQIESATFLRDPHTVPLFPQVFYRVQAW